MYSLKTKKEKIKKAREWRKTYSKNTLVTENTLVIKTISHHVDCLFEERKFMHTMQALQSFKH